jgi:hypothetical protein
LALLARWVWRGAITGEHRAERIPEVRAVLKGLEEPSRRAEEAAVQLLIESVPHDRPPLRPHAFRFSAARSKLDLLALASLGPRNLVDGAATSTGPLFANGSPAPRLDVGPLLAEHGARAVQTIWAGEDAPDAPERTLANLLIHPPLSRRLLMAALTSAPPEVLLSHGIDSEAGDALGAHNYPRMIELRARRLGTVVASFLDAHARWGETDRPSLASLAHDADPSDHADEDGDAQDARV